MDIPITNPQVRATVEDNSKTDDSFAQQGTTVNLGSGATYNQNCGNERDHNSKVVSAAKFVFSVICDIIIFIVCVILLNGQSHSQLKLEQFMREQSAVQKENENAHHKMIDQAEQRYRELISRIENEHKLETERYNQHIIDAQQSHKKLLDQAKDGTIWLLRDDLLKSIDYHEASKLITNKEYKRIKDEFAYYQQIGGNHDVEDRFDHFTTKIYGTGEIKMINGVSSKHAAENK